MSEKRTYFPPTSAQQRKLLFETWEATGDVELACQKAHVGRGTFYYWKARFESEGYAGLENYNQLGAPKGSGQTEPEIEEQVLKMQGENEEWGKHRIADELAKANNWVPVISPNTVRRILEDAGLWKADEKEKKRAASKQ
jgi:transposase